MRVGFSVPLVVVVVVLAVVVVQSTAAFSPIASCISKKRGVVSTVLAAEGSGGDSRKTLEESLAWDEGVDYDKEWPDMGGDYESTSSGEFLGDDKDKDSEDLDELINRMENKQLGVDLNLQLSDEQIELIKEQAREIIEKKVEENVLAVTRMRERMERDIARNRKSLETSSEFNAKRQSDLLLNKIDRLTNQFLESTKEMRESSKLAAAADRAMEGQGLELGAWGTLGDIDVPMGQTKGLLGSVDNAIVQKQRQQKKKQQQDDTDFNNDAATPQANRILIVADESKDPIAKKLLPRLTKQLQSTITGLEVEVLKPSTTMPLGGNNAACVVLFLPSLSTNPKSPLLDRLLRRTMLPGGQVSQPPTQLVAISTLGTERTNKFPYSMQNLIGRPLDQRREYEEAIIRIIQQRYDEPFLDYTILKLGEITDTTSKEDFSFMPGDVLDGTTSLETATEVLMQAVAFQPDARNATLSVVGNLPNEITLPEWDDLFLKLAGPELFRTTVSSDSDDDSDLEQKFRQLSEYLGEWATLLSKSQKLITPIRAERSPVSPPSLAVKQRAGVRLLFQATQTGKNYMSKDEERAREDETGGKYNSSNNKQSNNGKKQKNSREGGVEVFVEITHQNELRVRARRCNMADETVVKELSEESILSRLQESLAAFQKNYQS